MCPPASPCKGASVVQSPRTMRDTQNLFFVWKRRYADVRAGTQVPPLRFRLGGLRVGRLVLFGWIVCKWLFCLCGIAWKNMMEIGRGGACVPARVAPQGRIRRSYPHTMCVFLAWKRRCADVRAGTQAPPLRFHWGGLRVGRLMSFGWIACKWYFVCVELRGKI